MFYFAAMEWVTILWKSIRQEHRQYQGNSSSESESESMTESGWSEAAVAGAVTESAVAAGTVVRPVAGTVVAGSVVRPVAGAVVAGSVMTVAVAADALMSESVAVKSAVAVVSAMDTVSAVSSVTAVAAVTSEAAELPFFRLFGRGSGRYQRHNQSQQEDLKPLTMDRDYVRVSVAHSSALTVYWFMVKRVTDGVWPCVVLFYTVAIHPRYSEENAQNDVFEWDCLLKTTEDRAAFHFYGVAQKERYSSAGLWPSKRFHFHSGKKSLLERGCGGALTESLFFISLVYGSFLF